ncbi:MAG TPA: hypothetical protein VGM27_08440 [Acidobacteriaceae bacterium]
MKLRIQGNSLRLRVARSELARLTNGERVEEMIHFAPEPSAALRYVLASSSETDSVNVSYLPGEILVIVGSEQLRIWSAEDQVGIYATLDLGSFGSLAISVEKDFACLDGSDEKNRDTFVNPLGSRVC